MAVAPKTTPAKPKRKQVNKPVSFYVVGPKEALDALTGIERNPKKLMRTISDAAGALAFREFELPREKRVGEETGTDTTV